MNKTLGLFLALRFFPVHPSSFILYPSSFLPSRAARASQRARQNQRNRQISSVLHMSVDTPVCEKWRSIANWRCKRRLDAAGLHRRKVWQTGGLRSSAVGSEHGEMAL